MQTTSISRVLWPVRGGSQGYLVQDDTGAYWIAKFLGNPQGSRSLINEFLGSSILRLLSVSTPTVQLLYMPDALKAQGIVQFKTNGSSAFPSSGLHFGSAYVGDPNQTAVYEILPGQLLSKVSNLEQFGGMFVLDQWLGNADSRQVVFSRHREKGKSGPRAPLTAWFIDQGFMFSGSLWQIASDLQTPIRGVYLNRSVYSLFEMRRTCEYMLNQIIKLDEHCILNLQSQIPDCWYAPGDVALVSNLLRTLCARRSYLASLIEQKLLRLCSKTVDTTTESKIESASGGAHLTTRAVSAAVRDEHCGE